LVKSGEMDSWGLFDDLGGEWEKEGIGREVRDAA
jgi:hypothetical protein